MGKINTVIFDFDGTIMDTNRNIVNSWQHTFRTYTGKEGSEEYIYSTFGEPLIPCMERTFPNVPKEESVATYRKYQEGCFLDDIKLFPGMLELLERLKSKGYKLALATSRLKRTTMMGMGKFDLMKFFDVIVTAEDVSHHKPHPESVLKALEKLGSSASEAVMVGDTTYDILCGKNAGVKTILVAWSAALAGKKLEDFSQEERADHLVERAEEILQIAEKE